MKEVKFQIRFLHFPFGFWSGHSSDMKTIRCKTSKVKLCCSELKVLLPFSECVVKLVLYAHIQVKRLGPICLPNLVFPHSLSCTEFHCTSLYSSI